MAATIEAKIPVQDRTLWYSDLSYFPTEYKESRLWMAQSLFYAKLNSQRFLDPGKAREYRKTDLLEIDRQTYINLIDPPTPDGAGGKAEYFSADFKAFPIDAHLDNIMNANIRTIPTNITCTLADPIAKSLEQKDKERTIAQGMVRNIINWFLKELGKPPISESADPYKWIQNFTAEDGKEKVDEVGDVIDQIRLKIRSNDDLRLFQNYLYKNGLEVAFEVGIKYYFLDQNEFQVKYSDLFFLDIKHSNKACGRWAIDETTGQGQIIYIDPTTLWTSPFKDRNGDDILYMFHEENVNFAEFERLVGSEMDYNQKKKALEIQKKQGWISGAGFGNRSNQNNSQMRVGYYSILTQEANAFSEKYINDRDTVWAKEPLTWKPDKEDEGNKTAKVYNVWYSCYYLPITWSAYQNNSPVDWEEQSHFIFKIQKDIDMMRYGLDKRYAKSSFIIWNNNKQASYTDIKQAFMPKMHTLWHKFQNCIVQDVQGLALDYDLLGGMLNAVDEANAKEPAGGNGVVKEWKMLRQAGMAWVKFRDKNGNLVVQDPSKLFVSVDSGHMKKGEMYIMQMMNLYNLMTQALSKNQAGEGVQPPARTPLGGIEIANEASSKASYFIEESYIDGIIIPFAMRCAHHIHTICKERKTYNYEKRWKQFNDVVGRYNGAVIESIEDIQFENIGLTISNKEDSSKKEIIIREIVTKYAQNQMSASMFGLALGTDNWKQQIVELALEEQKREEQRQAEAAQQQQYTMEQKQMDLQIAQTLAGVKAQGVNSNIQTKAQMDAMLQEQENQLKASTMAAQKEQLLTNKLTENQQKAELNKDQKTHQANLEQQESLVGAI